MGKAAATAMRTVLADIEAANKLMSNRETVVKDITNPGPTAVKGGTLTQQDLKRVDRKHQDSVDEMMREVCGRLLGKKMSQPSTQQCEQVWRDAATFFNGRIQATAFECSGRNADMSQTAAQRCSHILQRPHPGDSV